MEEYESQKKNLQIYHQILLLHEYKKKMPFTLESAVSRILSPVVDMATAQKEHR